MVLKSCFFLFRSNFIPADTTLFINLGGARCRARTITRVDDSA